MVPGCATLADKSTQLLLDALSLAATEPTGALLFATRSDTGLFATTATGRAAAKRATDAGYLVPVPHAPDRVTLAEAGLQLLLEHASPKTVLEDFVRVLESRQSQLDMVLQSVQQLGAQLAGMRQTLTQILPHVQLQRATPQMPTDFGTSVAVDEEWTRGGTATATRPTRTATSVAHCAAAMLTHLADWASTAGAAQDCPLPELYRGVSCAMPDLSIGRFHDTLRELSSAGRVYLHPWTGPLYAVPEPTLALLVGHSVVYYASTRT